MMRIAAIAIAIAIAITTPTFHGKWIGNIPNGIVYRRHRRHRRHRRRAKRTLIQR